MEHVIEEYNFKDLLICVLICLTYVVALKSFVPYAENITEIEEWNLGFMSGKEMETIPGTEQGYFLPVNAYEDRFYIATRENHIYTLDGRAIIDEIEKDGSKMKAKIKTFEEGAILELPYIFYPGYVVKTDGMITNTFETEQGFLGVEINKSEEVELEVTYEGSELMKISAVVSLIGFVGYLIYITRKYTKGT